MRVLPPHRAGTRIVIGGVRGEVPARVGDGGPSMRESLDRLAELDPVVAIRAGACDRMGVTVAQLVPATADSAGTGRSAGDVGISLDSLLRHPYVVAFGPGGRPAACGALREGGIAP